MGRGTVSLTAQQVQVVRAVLLRTCSSNTAGASGCSMPQGRGRGRLLLLLLSLALPPPPTPHPSTSLVRAHWHNRC